MNIQDLKNQIGSFAKDIKINLGNVLSEEGAPELNIQQIAGIALCAAYATQNKTITEALIGEFSKQLDEAHQQTCKSAASIMSMNNIYYRFIHLCTDKDYAKMPAALRMQIIAGHGIEKADFELYCLAVSAINGCGMCIDAHVHEITKQGVSKTAVQSTIRIAAVIHAADQALALS